LSWWGVKLHLKFAGGGVNKEKECIGGGYSDFLLHENGRRIKLPRFWPEMFIFVFNMIINA
jgi:hypothetical protein